MAFNVCCIVLTQQKFWWLTSCGSYARSISLSTRKYDVSRDAEGRGSNFPLTPSVTTFPSRLISLLREGVGGGGGGGGGGGERRVGVGGVSEQLMTAARRDLLRSLEATETQLLSPEVSSYKLSLPLQFWFILFFTLRKRPQFYASTMREWGVTWNRDWHLFQYWHQTCLWTTPLYSTLPVNSPKSITRCPILTFRFPHTHIHPFHPTAEVRGGSNEVRVPPATGPDSIPPWSVHGDLETAVWGPVPGQPSGWPTGQSLTS